MSSNFWWLRRANPVKFTQKCVTHMEKHILIKKKCLQMGKIWVGLYKPELKRKSMKWKHTDFPVKKKFWSEKRLMFTFFKDMKGSITFDFASYCQFFMQNSPYLLDDLCDLLLYGSKYSYHKQINHLYVIGILAVRVPSMSQVDLLDSWMRPFSGSEWTWE